MDTIGEFLTRIRNSTMARHEKVDVPASNVRKGIAEILKENGFIRSYKVARDGRQGMMRVYLKYDLNGKPAIQKLRRVSRPGKRIYVKSNDIQPVRSGLGISIISTSHGVMTGNDAREKRVGGEILCNIW